MMLQVYKAVVNGEIERLDITASTFDEATMQVGHGVYAVFRLYEGQRVLHLEEHFKRMRNSALLLGRPYPLEDSWLRDHVRLVVRQSGIDLPRLRVIVPQYEPESAIIMIEPFAPPTEEIYTQGVRVGLVNLQREYALAKDSKFIERRREIRNESVYEVMMHDDEGYILEGTSSNFYAIISGTLFTAEDNILHGVARRLLLDVAPWVLPVVREPVHTTDLDHASEAFLTSASRGPIPIVAVGEHTIGDGKPGADFHKILLAYNHQVEQELENL